MIQQRAKFGIVFARGLRAQKQIRKAAAAWPISIDSPSIVRNPRASASISNGVRTGDVTMS